MRNSNLFYVDILSIHIHNGKSNRLIEAPLAAAARIKPKSAIYHILRKLVRMSVNHHINSCQRLWLSQHFFLIVNQEKLTVFDCKS